ncbi:MAG: hypothetical protein ACXVYB_11640 [Arthrobacter sp.]
MRDIPIPDRSFTDPHHRMLAGGRAGLQLRPSSGMGAKPDSIWFEDRLLRLEGLVAELRGKIQRRARVLPVNDVSSPAEQGGWLDALEDIADTALEIEFAAREAVLRIKIAALQEATEEAIQS